MSSPTRILMVGPSLSAAGGITSVMKTLVESGLADRFDIQVVATTGFGTGPLSRIRELGHVFMACAAVLSGRPLVHLHMSSGGSFLRKAMILWWAKLWRRPTLIHLHGGKFHIFATQNPLTRWLVRHTFCAADAVAVLSPEWCDRIRLITGRNDIIVLPNPVFVPSTTTAREPGIVFLGRLGRQKGILELLEAVARLQARGLVVPVVIAGDGDVAEVRAEVSRLPQPEAVSVPGWVGQGTVADYLSKYSVFCLPSFDEGKPISLLQAMGHGLACVSTPVGGIPDVLIDQDNGLLVPPGDADQLTAALERLLNDPDFAESLGLRARQLVISEYDVYKVVRDFEAVYQGILGDSSRARVAGTSIHSLRDRYERLPTILRFAVGSVARALPTRVRYGSVFVNTLNAATECEQNSVEELAFRQERQLARLVMAALRSEFWRETFVESGMPAGPRSVDCLRKLPLLDKETVRANVDRMLAEGYPPDRRKWVTTGGTAGQPLGLWIDKDASVRDWAFVVNAWSRVGFRLDERRLVLRGRRLGAGEQRKLLEYEQLRREMYVSVFDLDRDHLPEIRRAVRRFGSRYVHGYPSAMEVLGRSLKENNQKYRPSALLAVSENLYPGQRELLEKLYEGARLFSIYGMSEKGAFASECETSTELHVEPLYGYVELVDAVGNRVDEPGVRGEIVVTGLISRCMPLIRYRTGDYAAWSGGPCSCGRPHPRLGQIEGRWTQEYLVAKSGSKISMTALNIHSAAFDHVRRFQFVQETPGHVTLLIEPSESYREADGERLSEELSAKLSDQVVLTLKLVDRVPQTHLGKQRFIDQRIEA